MARRDRTDMTPATAAGWMAMLTIAIIAIIAAVSYIVLVAPAAQAAAPMALALPAGLRRAAGNLLTRWRFWRLQLAMRETERMILQYRRLLIEDSVHVDHLAQLLADQDAMRRELQHRLGRPDEPRRRLRRVA